MFFKCHKCSTVDDQVTLHKEGNKIICPKCKDVILDNFVEEDGVIVGVHKMTIPLNAGDFLFMQKNSDNPKENMHLIVNENFPRQPYTGGKKIKKYDITFRYSIKVYYE